MAQPNARVYPALVLPIAEVCPGVLDLAVNEPRSDGIERLWREAFYMGASPPTAHTVESYKRLRGFMPDLLAIDVAGAVEDYQADMRTGDVLPTLHRFAFEVDGDLEGRVPAKGGERISIVVDCAWCVSPGADGEGKRAVVLQHELARLGSNDVKALDIMFAGIAMSAIYGTDRAQLGRCIHSPGKPPVYKWTAILTEDAMQGAWERISHTLKRRREYVTSELCESCPYRKRCPAWMLPAGVGGSMATYRTLTGQDPLAANDVPAVRRYVKSLREAADMAEGQMRALKREGGA